MTSRRILEKDCQSMSRSRGNSITTPVSCPKANSPVYGIVYRQAGSWIGRQRSLLQQWFLLLLIRQQCLLFRSASGLSANSITETEMISKLGHYSEEESSRGIFLLRRIWKTSETKCLAPYLPTLAVTCAESCIQCSLLPGFWFLGHSDEIISSNLADEKEAAAPALQWGIHSTSRESLLASSQGAWTFRVEARPHLTLARLHATSRNFVFCRKYGVGTANLAHI